MIRAFVDASVLVAAVFSPTGGASALLEMAICGRVDLLISADIVEEVKRNVPKLADKFEALLELVHVGASKPLVACHVLRATWRDGTRSTQHEHHRSI